MEHIQVDTETGLATSSYTQIPQAEIPAQEALDAIMDMDQDSQEPCVTPADTLPVEDVDMDSADPGTTAADALPEDKKNQVCGRTSHKHF
jgi:hypothetical protein